jgi:hypothetical protein
LDLGDLDLRDPLLAGRVRVFAVEGHLHREDARPLDQPLPVCTVVPVNLTSVMIPRPGNPVSRSFLSTPPVIFLKRPITSHPFELGG